MTVGYEHNAAHAFVLCFRGTGWSWYRTPLPFYGSGGLAVSTWAAHWCNFPRLSPRDLHQLRRRHLEEYLPVVLQELHRVRQTPFGGSACYPLCRPPRGIRRHAAPS
jgi:hypothetical protein